jgi:CRP/FNR family transcriptional regulator, cyclic AMP receptor protein
MLDSFGAAMSDRPRSTSVSRLQPVVAAIPLFGALEAREQQRLCEGARTQRVVPGEVIVERGGPPEALYAVATGKLKVVAPRDGGRDATLRILGPGDVFGEVAFFQPEGRTARVTALEESVVLVVERRVFLDLIARSPLLCQRLLALMATRLQDTIAHFDATTSLDVSRRLARTLLLLLEHFGAPAGDGVGLELELSQRDLGDLIDSTRQTVNRQLRVFASAGILRNDGGHLVVLDVDALRRAAEPPR